MKTFFAKHKYRLAFLGVLILFTVLLSVPFTLKIFTGVFGYLAYLYLAVGYVALVLSVKKIRLRVPKKNLLLYILTALAAGLTLHVGLCGQSMVNAGFGGYVGSSFEHATTGGVLFSLLSLPFTLTVKYIASVCILFVLTATGGFFVIQPLVFVTNKKKKPESSVKADKEPALYTESLPLPAELAIEDKPQPTLNLISEVPPVDSREQARRFLFGDAVEKPLNKTKKMAEITLKKTESGVAKTTLLSEKVESPMLDGIVPLLVRPNDAVYTSDYMRASREDARSKLFGNPPSAVPTNPFSEKPDVERTIGRELSDEMSLNPYIPGQTIFEREKLTSEVIFDRPDLSVNVPSMPNHSYGDVPSHDRSAPPRESDGHLRTESNENMVASSSPTRTDTLGDSTSHFLYAGEHDRAELGLPEISESLPDGDFPELVDSPFANAVRQPSYGTPRPTGTPQETVQKYRLADTLNETVGTQLAINPNNIIATVKSVPVQKMEEILPVRVRKKYVAPSIAVFKDHVKEGFSPYVENYQELKEVFEVKLKNFNIDMHLVDVIKGPTITMCILELSEKCTISKVLSVRQDISRLLKTDNNAEINIVTKLPGSSYFGIEVPNAVKGVVSFKEVLASADYANAKGNIVLALGKTNAGKIVVDDLAEMPHALIAGSTGSGKSVCINAILASILYRYSPDDVKLILIDLKFVEMANFAGLPHMLFKEPLNDIPEVINALKWLREETFRRFNLFKDLHVRNINEYNNKMDKDNCIPRIIIIIDEASELMSDTAGRKTVENTLSSLARVARAAGVHMIFATQNPVKEVITNEIQNNLNTKIAFAVGDYVHSMVIFKASGAEKLLGKGDMIIKKGSEMQRSQCAFVSTEEIESMVDFIKAHNDAEFDDDMIERILHGSKEEIPPDRVSVPLQIEKKNLEEDEEFQSLVKESLLIFFDTDRISCTYLQRRFSKGYNTIANLMDYLEDKGYVSAQVNNKRKLLLTREAFNALYPSADDERI